LGVVEDRLERKLDCKYLGRLASDILAKLWRSNTSYIAKAEEFFALRIDPKERDYRVLIELLDILDVSNRETEAWCLLERFLGVEELSIQLIAKRIPLAISDLTNAFASLEYYRQFRRASPLADYAQILDRCGLRPHDEVPEILFHLLLPAYVKLGALLQDVDSQKESEVDLEIVLDTYRLVSRTFAGFGGSLASPDMPESVNRRAELIAGGAIAGLDLPLIEMSRLLGFLFGVSKRDFPERYQGALVKATSTIHENWIEGFLTAVGVDWKIESLRNSDSSDIRAD
jgi:hypothetical protein